MPADETTSSLPLFTSPGVVVTLDRLILHGVVVPVDDLLSVTIDRPHARNGAILLVVAVVACAPLALSSLILALGVIPALRFDQLWLMSFVVFLVTGVITSMMGIVGLLLRSVEVASLTSRHTVLTTVSSTRARKAEFALERAMASHRTGRIGIS